MSSEAWIQFRYLYYELSLMINKRWWRIFSIWFSTSTHTIINYRFERFFYLLFGRAYGLIRILLLPILFLTQPWRGHCEIHYRANIGKGLKILHPALGIVISAKTICGENLILTGGNCIGLRGKEADEVIIIGNNVTLGANAVVLGPIQIGNNVKIGAGAIVLHDAPDGSTIIGYAARGIDR